jgi:hypothetical protein
MKTFKPLFLLFTVMMTPFFLSAQGAKSVLEETFFSSGKMPVVLSVVLIILLGLVIYIALLNKKVNKLEKDINK